MTLLPSCKGVRHLAGQPRAASQAPNDPLRDWGLERIRRSRKGLGIESPPEAGDWAGIGGSVPGEGAGIKIKSLWGRKGPQSTPGTMILVWIALSTVLRCVRRERV